MPPKKKKGGKGKKGKEPKETDALTAVDRTFYELTITDLNNKLARLRTHCAKLEGSNDDLYEKMRQFDEDRTDVTAHLDRQLAEKVDVIREMDERLIELAKVREQENKNANDKIKEWENKYKAMHEQLTSEIKLLNGKLHSLEEFRLQRGDLLMKFDEQETETKEERRKHQEMIHEMEQKAIIEKDQLKKDVEAKLLQLSEDFTKSSEIRVAGYTRRLIRENIALNKEMDKMVSSQIRMEDENKKMNERGREIELLFEASESVKKRLVKTCQNQIEIIENLTKQYEVLEKKYQKITHYKKLYETSLKRDICERFSYNEMAKKLRIMAQRVEMLKSDKQKLISFHQQHEAEIIRLNNILKNIKFTVMSAIRSEKNISDDPDFRAAQRQTLLSELMQVLTSYTDEVAFTPSAGTISPSPSIYRPGIAGFTPKTAESLFELFKREAKKIASAELISPAFKAKTMDGKITPKPREVQGETLIDVVSGSTLILSTSTTAEELPPEGGLEDEQADFGASTSSESVEALQDSKTSVKKAAPTQPSKQTSLTQKSSKHMLTKQVSVERKERSVIEAAEQDEEKKSKISSVKAEEEEEHVQGSSIGSETAEGESILYMEAALEHAEEEEEDAGYFFY